MEEMKWEKWELQGMGITVFGSPTGLINSKKLDILCLVLYFGKIALDWERSPFE